jgi:hypothetical protein
MNRSEKADQQKPGRCRAFSFAVALSIGLQCTPTIVRRTPFKVNCSDDERLLPRVRCFQIARALMLHDRNSAKGYPLPPITKIHA